MKAPSIMIDAVKKINIKDRKQAAALAEKTFHAKFQKLQAFGDFSEKVNIEMAAEAAAAEVCFIFA